MSSVVPVWSYCVVPFLLEPPNTFRLPLHAGGDEILSLRLGTMGALFLHSLRFVDPNFETARSSALRASKSGRFNPFHLPLARSAKEVLFLPVRSRRSLLSGLRGIATHRRRRRDRFPHRFSRRPTSPSPMLSSIVFPPKNFFPIYRLS